MPIRFVSAIAWIVLLGAGSVSEPLSAPSQKTIIKVRSNDGAAIAVECTGVGPTLLIVHGGTGDRRRWEAFISPLRASFYCLRDGSPRSRPK